MVELSVRLAANDEVHALNAQWRGKDKATNVLSFPMAEADELAAPPTPGPELMLGDIILAHGVCARRGRGQGHSHSHPCRAPDGARHASLARLRPYGRCDRRRHGGARDKGAGPARHCRSLCGWSRLMADDEPENGSRLWRGMRALIFGDDAANRRFATRSRMRSTKPRQADRRRGDLSPHERQMLRNLLHFGDRTAGEVSVPRGDIVAVSQDVSFDGLVGAFADAEHSRLPVYGDGLDDIIGMIHIKDVYKALNRRQSRPHDRRAAPQSVVRPGIDGRARIAGADAQRPHSSGHRRRRIRRHRGARHDRGRGRGNRRRYRGRA